MYESQCWRVSRRCRWPSAAWCGRVRDACWSWPGWSLGRRAAASSLRGVPEATCSPLAVPGLSVVPLSGVRVAVRAQGLSASSVSSHMSPSSGIFLVSGAAADGSMTDLHVNARRDLKSLAARPSACWSRACSSRARWRSSRCSRRQVDATDGAGAGASAAHHRAADRVRAAEYEALPRVPVAVPTDGAKVLIVRFNDYQCPPCRMTWEQVQPVIAEMPGHVSRRR